MSPVSFSGLSPVSFLSFFPFLSSLCSFSLLPFPFFFLLLTKVTPAATWLNLRPNSVFSFACVSCTPWTMLKAEHFIITWLGPLCTWTTWLVFFRSSNRPLNGTTPCLRHISAWIVQIPEASTPLFLYLPHLIHQPWYHMQEFHHKWSSILNRTYVPPHHITQSTVRQNTLQAPLMSPAIQFLQMNTLSVQRQEHHSLRNLLGPPPGPQFLFQFGPSTGLIDRGPSTQEETEISPNRGSPYLHYRTVWPSWPASHHLRRTTCRLQLGWIRLRRRWFRTWTSTHGYQ